MKAPTDWKPEFSARHVQVLRSLMKHGNYRDVGAELGITVKTVEGHMQAIYDRAMIPRRNVVQLVLAAEREGWVK